MTYRSYKAMQQKRRMVKRLIAIVVAVAIIVISLIALISINKADNAKANAYVTTITYRIAYGDNLHKIARACGSEATEDSIINVIYLMNEDYFNHHSVDKLTYGDIITIPVY